MPVSFDGSNRVAAVKLWQVPIHEDDAGSERALRLIERLSDVSGNSESQALGRI